jgi:hypothetical protein
MCPTPTYSDRAETDPALPDEDEPARRSKWRITRDDPRTDAQIDLATLKPQPPIAEP